MYSDSYQQLSSIYNIKIRSYIITFMPSTTNFIEFFAVVCCLTIITCIFEFWEVFVLSDITQQHPFAAFIQQYLVLLIYPADSITSSNVLCIFFVNSFLVKTKFCIYKLIFILKFVLVHTYIKYRFLNNWLFTLSKTQITQNSQNAMRYINSINLHKQVLFTDCVSSLWFTPNGTLSLLIGCN